MAKIEQFKCDGCGKPKTDVNHWWKVLRYDYIPPDDEREFGLLLQPIEDTLVILQPYPLDGARPEPEIMEEKDFEVYHFCGQQCALAFISAQMAGGQKG
jgi:hypothetical protein